MPLTLREYGRMLDGGGRRELPAMAEYAGDYGEDGVLVRRYTFRWTDIEEGGLQPAEGEGETVRSPGNACPFHLYPVEQQEVRRERVRDSPYGIPEVRELVGVDAAVRDELVEAYDGDLDAVYWNHVEVVPFRMELVPPQPSDT